MYDFDPETYWATRDKKKWVVTVRKETRENRKRKTIVRHVCVSATTRAGAIRTGRCFSFFKGRISATARLARPEDLGCVPAGSGLCSW